MSKGENLYSKLKKEGQIYQCVIIVTIIATDVAAATVCLRYFSAVIAVAGAVATDAVVTGVDVTDAAVTDADAEVSITAGTFPIIATKLPVAVVLTHITRANTVCAIDAVATPIRNGGRLAAVTAVVIDAITVTATTKLKQGILRGTLNFF